MTDRVLKPLGLGLAGLTLAALICMLTAPFREGNRHEEECQWNLRNIDRAKYFAALEHHLTNGAHVPMDWIVVYLDGILPKCPAGGVYHINPVGTPPLCSCGGKHVPVLEASPGEKGLQAP